MRNLTSEIFDSCGLVVNQPEEGYRYGAPTIVLAEFASVGRGLRAVELGSGCGVVSMVLAARCEPASVVAVEIQRGLHEIAVRNVEANNLGGVIDCVNADYRDFARGHRGSFDAAVANPPFYASGRGRVPADPERAAAHHEMNGTLPDLIDAARLILVPGGKFTVVFPDSRRIELMEEASRRGFEARRIARGGSPGSKDALFLVEFVIRVGL